MKYSELNLTETQLKERSLIKGDFNCDCAVCHKPTLYVDFCFEQRVCSEECHKIMNERYDEYLRRL